MTENSKRAMRRRKKDQFLKDPHRPGYWRTNLWRHIDKEEVPGYNQLCTICKRVVDVLPTLPTMALGPDIYDFYKFETLPGIHLEHHPTLGTLKLSAKNGCHLCSLLARPGYGGVDSADADCYQMQFEVPQDKGTARIAIKLATGLTWFTDLELDLWNNRPPPFYCQTLFCTKTNDRQVLDLAKEWLGTCLRKHKRCVNSGTLGQRQQRPNLRDSSPRYLPSRLIQVKFIDGIVASARLVVGSALDSKSSYLTLSHCWGGADVVKLTTKTLESFKTEIPLLDLPRSFSDALLVTGYLGFEYIWIDSLCIVQDSDKDWKIESEQMGNIYWHSECTIAAVKAHNSHEGLFSERNPLSFVPYKLPEFVPKIGSDHLENNKSYSWVALNQRTELGPLYTRAWVVQERALARRTLHFTENSILWECLTMSASERGKSSGGVLKAERDRILNGDKRFPTDNANAWISDWWSILQAYSKCSLTFSTDRFHAIEGLATLVQQAKNISILHGLWQPFLITELLWGTQRPRCTERLPNTPSWSWTSTHGEVFNRFTDFLYDPSIKATVTLKDHDALASSASTTQALLVTAHLLPITWTEPVQFGSRTEKAYPFYFRDGGTVPTPHQRSTWLWHWNPDILPQTDWELWALQIIPNRSLVPAFQSPRQGVGLIVLPVNEEKTVFQRVGYYSITWDTKLDDNKGPILFYYPNGIIEREFGEMRTIQLI